MPDARTPSPEVARVFAAWQAGRVENLAAIAETVKQSWPRCGGERIDPADAWSPYFTDAQVVAWLEAGVFTAAAAIRLINAGWLPRDVAGQYEVGVTYGLSFARGDISFAQLLREVEC